MSASPAWDPQGFIVDQYSALSHKTIVGENARTLDAREVPSWVPRDQRRRLAAYLILDAYRRNCVRRFLSRASLVDQSEHREYGDAALIINRVAHGVLGDDFAVEVEGADDDLGDGPVLPERPTEPPADALPIERTVFDARKKRWEADAQTAVEDWITRFEDQPNLQVAQDQLRDWADQVGLAAKLTEGEFDAVGLGDTVYALWPAGDKQWPVLRRYDPDSYFPLIGDDPDGFPDKVHIAWGLEETQPDGSVKCFVRRLTWELIELDGRTDTTGAPVTAQAPPWAEAGDPAPTRTCVVSDGMWSLDNLEGGIPDLSEAAAIWREDERGPVHNRNLMIDFIPVIHVPNTPASRTHFGEASLSTVAQILDDLGQSDSDLMEVARLVAGPVMWFSGVAVDKDQPISPLATFNLGADGKAGLMDLSVGLEKMMTFGDRLVDRLLINARVPKALVGHMTSADAPSGIAMLIDAAPFAEVIGTLRMTREPKYALMLKFSARMAMVAGALEPGPVPAARVAFGSFLPMDRSQVVTEVTALFAAKLVARDTAIRLLIAAGFAIDDAREEVSKIEREDIEAAKTLADATGSEQAAADRLGVQLPDKPKPPDVQLPPPPNQPPEVP